MSCHPLKIRNTSTFYYVAAILASLNYCRTETAQINFQQPVCPPPGIHSFVVGGNDTLPNEFPWIVNIRQRHNDQDTFICGATLIDWDLILTAAHCLVRNGTRDEITTDKLIVVAGDYNLTCIDEFEKVATVAQVKVHENFNWNVFEHDVAIIKLDKRFTKSKGIDIIPLAPSNILEQVAMVAGWGATNVAKISVEPYSIMPF